MMLLALACLVLATTVGVAPSMRIERKASIRVRDGPTDILAIAADIELFAACIHSGLSTAHAATAVASVSENEQWRSVQALLAIGVGAGRAWEPSGGALSTGCERIVDKLRNDTAHAATAAAERAGVLIALPLAVCYLPAFFILGLAPTVISLGATMLN